MSEYDDHDERCRRLIDFYTAAIDHDVMNGSVKTVCGPDLRDINDSNMDDLFEKNETGYWLRPRKPKVLYLVCDYENDPAPFARMSKREAETLLHERQQVRPLAFIKEVEL